jgi:hypothetical protein
MQFGLDLDSTVVLGAIIFPNKYRSSSHNDAVRTGPTVIVQRGDFEIAGGCGPLENLIRCSFANELVAVEPENFTHIGIGFGA